MLQSCNKTQGWKYCYKSVQRHKAARSKSLSLLAQEESSFSLYSRRTFVHVRVRAEDNPSLQCAVYIGSTGWPATASECGAATVSINYSRSRRAGADWQVNQRGDSSGPRAD